ncbi:hypothetical protein CRX72_04145 [Pantoea sp. BRM17]|nr:hypothetical protein CRX72_04145 [Pantoea sp. BRM17]
MMTEDEVVKGAISGNVFENFEIANYTALIAAAEQLNDSESVSIFTRIREQEQLIDWVRDAHAMEKQAESMLEKMAARLEHYPDLKARIEQHIDETREQQQLVQSVIDRYDTSRSVIKDMNPERAREAGKKGGQVSGGNFRNNPERAIEAGRKGGKKSRRGTDKDAAQGAQA